MVLRFDPVPLVGAGPDVVEDIVAWIASAPLVSLIAEFGGEPELLSAQVDDVATRLAGLDNFTARWDTRKVVNEISPTSSICRSRRTS